MNSDLGDLYADSGQTLQGSFSAVSKPKFACKYSLKSSRRDLHNSLLCTVWSRSEKKKRSVQRSALCRSRRELSNEYLLANFGFDTAENEPCKVCPLSACSLFSI